MKILLIYPNVLDLARYGTKRKEFPPFGTLYLASAAEKCGYDVEIRSVDVEESLDLTSYDVVGFSIPSSSTFGIVKKVRFCSKYRDGGIILVGGVHANLYPIETFTEMEPDFLSFGESENTFVDILDAIVRKDDVCQVKGVYYSENGRIKFSGERNSVERVDWKNILPARHLLDHDLFLMNNRLSNTNMKMAHVMFSRGCPFSCAFCAASKTGISYRSGDNVRKEIIHLKEVYAIDGFAVTDDNFIVNKHNVSEISTAIKDLDVYWSALSRVDTFREDVAKCISEAGCIEVKFGIESGNEWLLKRMRKNTTREQIVHAIIIAKKYNLKVKAFIIHGFPGENMKTTVDSISLLEKIKEHVDRVSLFRFVPLPGSYVFRHPDEFHLHLNGNDWDRYHIYNNDHHWWGTTEDFLEMNNGYNLLKQYIEAVWPETF